MRVLLLVSILQRYTHILPPGMVIRGGSGDEDENDVAFNVAAGLSASCNADAALP